MKRSIKKNFTLALVAAGAAWAIYLGAFVHMYFLEGMIAQERKDVAVLRAQQDQALALRSVKSNVKENVTMLENAVITQRGRVGALEYIEQLAQTYAQQAVLQNVEEPKDGATTVKFTLAAQGSWRQLYTLLRKIETMQYIASIDKVELQKFSNLGGLSQTDSRSGDVISVGQPQTGFGSGWRLTMELSVLTETATPNQ